MKCEIVLIIAGFIHGASCAKILALMVVASHSHHSWNSKYLEALASRGHQITYFGVDVYKNIPENITSIVVENIYEVLHSSELTEISEAGPYKSTLLMKDWDELEASLIMKSKGFEELNRLLREEKFDLVVHDIGVGAFLLGAVDVLGRPPVIGITAFGVPTWALEILGNPMAYSSKPYFYTPYSATMTFIQRANNYFLHLFSFAVRWFSMRNQDEYSRNSFGKDVRPLEQILDDINIIMVNANPGVDHPFPKVPGLIPVGGLHIQQPKPLPQDLKSYLDNAKNGVVYFSLGSNILSSTLQKEKLETLMKAFKALSPMQVLWKFETDSLPGKPENVKISKWLPQNDILAHPNVRLFFTHSGLLSTQEAVYHGKPIVGMPFFLDQHVNVMKCMEKGLGEKLDFVTITPEKVEKTIRKVLEDPRYAKNARKASAIFRDELERPLDRAVYWTEYAIRHKGAPHLRHAAKNLFWFQNWMLDVLLLTVTMFSLAVISIRRLTSRRRKISEKAKQN